MSSASQTERQRADTSITLIEDVICEEHTRAVAMLVAQGPPTTLRAADLPSNLEDELTWNQAWTLSIEGQALYPSADYRLRRGSILLGPDGSAHLGIRSSRSSSGFLVMPLTGMCPHCLNADSFSSTRGLGHPLPLAVCAGDAVGSVVTASLHAVKQLPQSRHAFI